MAPNFLSKLVNKATPTHTRDRSDQSSKSPRSSSSRPRSRAPSSAAPAPPLPPSSPSPAPAPKAAEKMTVPTFTTTNVDGDEESGAESDSTFPSVTIVPPSPLVGNRDLSRTNSESSLPNSSSAIRRTDGAPDNDMNGNMINGSGGRHRTTSQSASTALDPADDELSTPTTPRPRTTSNSSTKSKKSTKFRSRPTTPVTTKTDKSFMPPKTLEPSSQVRKQPSNWSLNRPPPVTIDHTRSATTPETPGPPARASTESQDGQAAVYTPQNQIVESPTAMQLPDYPSPPQSHSSPQSSTSPSGSSAYLASPKHDADSVSIISTNGTSKEKKRPWSRSTVSRKPTGLASAIAASSLAMANHSLTPAQQAQLSAAATVVPPNSAASTRKLSSASQIPPSPARHKRTKSNEMSPSSKSARSRRAGSVSIHSDDRSEYYPGEDRPEYYSGLEDSSDDEDDDSDDNLDDLDLGEDDIPVTGFAVASNKRNADFHELFPSIPEGDYLIDDYGCALQREILIQGRLYISENHICFHANIFGWITDLSIPINEVTHLEKKMTAFVIPNGIQVTTRQNKYTFASFLSRDTTYDVIHNIWKLERPDDAASISSAGRASYDAPGMTAALGGTDGNGAVTARKATTCTCGKEGKHFSETALEAVVPGTPEKIYGLMFASGFMKEFMTVNQKLMDIQISDWTPTAPNSKLLARNMSYIKPLNSSLGPKQTKCEIRDETMACDFDDYVSMLTTTRTPEVPSGGVFAVKTRTCVMWAGPVSTRIVVTTEVEWTGRSFIKGIIERSAIDGQKVYHSDLETAMRAYIKEHQTEFIPAGVDLAAISPAPTKEAAGPEEGAEAPPKSEEEERKMREKERNQRGLQWAWDTFDGAYQVAKTSTKGALELVQDAWEQSSTTTALYFVIVGLVFSNIYTLMRSGKREDLAVRKSLRKEEEREKWVQGVVTALWDELGAAKAQQTSVSLPPGIPPVAASWREEIAQLLTTLDLAEERIRTLKSGLKSVEQLDSVD